MKHVYFPLLLVGFCLPLSAQIFVDGNAFGGNNDGSSWENAFLLLQDALAGASEDDEIWVAGNLYTTGFPDDNPDATWFDIDKALRLYGGFAGTETELSERDLEANPTILSADLMQNDIPGDFETNREDNGLHVILIDSTAVGQVIIDGFFIEGGHTNTNAPGGPNFDFNPYIGGGILTLNQAIIRNCTFRHNFSQGGGAMTVVFRNSNGTIIEDCHFENNLADFVGGALNIGLNNNVAINNCTFLDNESFYGGGAIRMVVEADTFRIQDSWFEGNESSTYGGALMVEHTNDAGLVEVTASTFDTNQAAPGMEDGWGGAGFITSEGNIHFTNCEFIENFADSGGALEIQNGASAKLEQCTFHKNAASFGGAVGAASFPSASNSPVTYLDISDCSFNQNTATLSGGGLLFYAQASGKVTGSSFTNNSATYAGGLGFAGTPGMEVYTTLIVDACWFEENTGTLEGGAMNVQEIGDAVVTNSIFTNNFGEGAGILLAGTPANPCEMVVTNTTFFNNDNSIHQNNQSTIKLQNSIVYQESGEVFSVEAALTPQWISLGGNLCNDDSMEEFFDLQLSDQVDQDPLFVSATDFHLTSESPCIDAGIVTSGLSEFDFEGNPRVQGNNIDIGAYESPFVNQVIDHNSNIQLSCYPNPVVDWMEVRLESDQNGPVTFRLFALNGQLIQEIQQKKWTDSATFRIEMSELLPGAYYLEALMDNNRSSVEVVKQ